LCVYVNLYVETEAGNAFVNLQVGLGQAQPHPSTGQHAGGRRGGGPAKKRRRERRKAAQQLTAEQAAAATAEQDGLDSNKASAEQAVHVAEEDIIDDSSTISQIDGSQDDTEKVTHETSEYQLKVEAHEKCQNYDIIEAIEVNYDGTMDDLKIEKNDPARFILVQKEIEADRIDDRNINLVAYRVIVRDKEVAKTIIEGWREPHKFDDLAFRKAVYGKIRVRIREVQKL
jgi:hypothetical protein